MSYASQTPGQTGTARGFTLLEVIVALTITGFVLGGLFTLIGGSKRLVWTSEESLVRAIDARASINYALLHNELDDVEPVLEKDSYNIVSVELLEPPERKTQPSLNALQSFEVVHEERETLISGTRWIRLELPQ
ncbi:MAG: prepilin-type N-terminal cleavage/methylation domain-containing protein [Pseudohongiellaceae bacterium]